MEAAKAKMSRSLFIEENLISPRFIIWFLKRGIEQLV
jgi:hypothetical protein